MNTETNAENIPPKKVSTMMEALKRLFKPRKPGYPPLRENEPLRPMSYVVIDEHSPNNPFVENPGIPIAFDTRPKNWFLEGSVSPQGIEGFSHNPDAQRHIGHMLANVFELSDNASILEFGCGGNYEIAQGLLDAGCKDVILLDYNSAENNTSVNGAIPANRGQAVLENVPMYSGEFSRALDATSALHSRRNAFDFIMCNSALFSSGYNFTTAYLGESLYHESPGVDHNDRTAIDQFIQNYIEQVFHTAQNLLKEGGTFFFSSSRFANHGAGFADLELHLEKSIFLQYIGMLRQQGATEITLFGVSSQGIMKSIENNLGSTAESLQRQQNIFKNVFLYNFEPPFKIEIEENSVVRSLTWNELETMSDDPQQFETLMQVPEIRAVVEEKLLEMEDKLQKMVNSLTAPMPDFPPGIARIDAVAAKF